MKQRTFIILGFILIFGGILRFWGLGERTIWIDEGYGVFYSDQSWEYLWQTVPDYEVHLPSYYSMLKSWRALAGSDEAALRAPSALASVGVMICLFLAGRIAGGARFGIRLGLLAAALFAVWKLQIEFARDARPYAFCALGMALTLIGTLHILTSAEQYRNWPWKVLLTHASSALSLLALSFGMALMLWSHYVGAIAALTNAIFLLTWWAVAEKFNFRLFCTLGASALLIIFLFAPGIPLILNQSGDMPDQFWNDAPSFLGLMSITTKGVVQPLPLLGFSTDLATILALIIALPFFILGIIGYFKATQEEIGKVSVFIYPLYLCVSIWVTLVILTYSFLPLILPRTLVFIVPPALILLSGFQFALRENYRIVATAALLGLSALGTINLVRDTERPFAPIVRLIAESDAPDVPVLVLPNSVVHPMHYYNERWGTRLDFRPLPEPFPARSDDYVYVTGNKAAAAVHEDRLMATIADIGYQETVWTVTRLKNLYDPNGLIDERLAATGRCPLYIYGLDRTAMLVKWSFEQCKKQTKQE